MGLASFKFMAVKPEASPLLFQFNIIRLFCRFCQANGGKTGRQKRQYYIFFGVIEKILQKCVEIIAIHLIFGVQCV
jgi:hypothetical protein